VISDFRSGSYLKLQNMVEGWTDGLEPICLMQLSVRGAHNDVYQRSDGAALLIANNS